MECDWLEESDFDIEELECATKRYARMSAIRSALILILSDIADGFMLFALSARDMPFFVFLAWSIPLLGLWSLGCVGDVYGPTYHLRLWGAAMLRLSPALMVTCALLSHWLY